MRHIEQDTYDVVITDLVMNDVDGMEVLARAKQCLPDAEVIMVTGHASVPKAVEAMQQGAFNFLEKPITPNRLRAVTERAADAVRLRRDNLELNKRLDERFGFEGIIYTSDSMKQVIDRVKRIAPTDATVLITGDSGTGKELIAQAIHQNSPRKGKRLFPLNCAAVAENLVESELFGHVKGAYTDAAPTASGRSSMPTAARCFSTKSATCRGPRRPSCCACSRRTGSPAWATTSRSKSTSAWCRRPTAAWKPRSPAASSARTCTIDSRS